MFKKKEMHRKKKEEQEKHHTKKILKKEWMKVKIPTIKVKKSFNLNTMMMKSENTIDLHLSKDGTESTISWRFFQRNMKI